MKKFGYVQHTTWQEERAARKAGDVLERIVDKKARAEVINNAFEEGAMDFDRTYEITIYKEKRETDFGMEYKYTLYVRD